MVQFPDRPYYQGPSQPSRFEIDIADVETEGDIPAQLNGAYYRVGPDPQFPPRAGKDIYFNGDGVVSMFRFDKGRVDFKHRFVQTDKWKLEREAGRALFGVYRSPSTDDPSVKGRYRGTANTNVLAHAGQLFALKEDSPPVAMDPLTLETRGYWDFHGRLNSETFTAHPKIDRETCEMVALSYATGGIATPTMALHTIDRNGRIVHDVRFEAPYYCMVHDYGLTKDYVVFHIIPLTGSLDRTNPEAPHFGFDKTLDVYVGVIPRRGDARDLRWFKGPNQFCSHVMNAFNEGTRVHIDVPVAEGNMFPFFPDIDGTPFNPARAQSRITRWTVDLSANSDVFSAETLTDFVGEMPRIDDRYLSHPYRHGWVLEFGMGAGGPKFALGHLDHATRKSTRWSDPAYALQEPAFIPKGPNAAEGEGYIVQLAGKMAEHRSDLLIFDALRIADGPIGKVKLPVFVRNGLHGNWHPIEELARAA